MSLRYGPLMYGESAKWTDEWAKLGAHHFGDKIGVNLTSNEVRMLQNLLVETNGGR